MQQRRFESEYKMASQFVHLPSYHIMIPSKIFRRQENFYQYDFNRIV